MQRKAYKFLCLPLVLFVANGCIAPRVTVLPSANLETYRKVYAVQPPDDPRGVFARVVSRLKKSGFDVVEVKPDGAMVESQGSGFVITPRGDVLTCAHVLGTETNATVWIQDVRHEGRVVASDTNADLAVILLDGQHDPFQPLPFAAGTNYHMGQDVYTMGFPLAQLLGTAPRLNKGLISSTVGMDDDPKQLQVSAQVQPGNSGGPLLNDRGEAIGVMSGTLNAMNVFVRSGGALPQNVNFAIKAVSITDFLDASHVVLPVAPTNASSADIFDQANKSLALVRAGNVTEEDVKRSALVCHFAYASFWDMYFRFRGFQIIFEDAKTGDLVLNATRMGDDLSSEDATLNRVFREVYPKFFPGQTNPFEK